MLFEVNTVIDSYSRKQAIEDGLLIDVTQYANEAGFKCSVCVTSSVWATINNIPEEVKYQDVVGRLWDVLNVLRFLAKGNKSPFIEFDVEMQHYVTIVDEDCPERDIVAHLLSLYSVAGPGDNGEFVITIMLPGED